MVDGYISHCYDKYVRVHMFSQSAAGSMRITSCKSFYNDVKYVCIS